MAEKEFTGIDAYQNLSGLVRSDALQEVQAGYTEERRNDDGNERPMLGRLNPPHILSKGTWFFKI